MKDTTFAYFIKKLYNFWLILHKVSSPITVRRVFSHSLSCLQQAGRDEWFGSKDCNYSNTQSSKWDGKARDAHPAFLRRDYCCMRSNSGRKHFLLPLRVSTASSRDACCFSFRLMDGGIEMEWHINEIPLIINGISNNFLKLARSYVFEQAQKFCLCQEWTRIFFWSSCPKFIAESVYDLNKTHFWK